MKWAAPILALVLVPTFAVAQWREAAQVRSAGTALVISVHDAAGLIEIERGSRFKIGAGDALVMAEAMRLLPKSLWNPPSVQAIRVDYRFEEWESLTITLSGNRADYVYSLQARGEPIGPVENIQLNETDWMNLADTIARVAAELTKPR